MAVEGMELDLSIPRIGRIHADPWSLALLLLPICSAATTVATSGCYRLILNQGEGFYILISST